MRGFRLSGELVIALCVLALAVFLAVDTSAIGVQTYGRIGPRVFPIIVTVMMGVLGVALFFQALTGRWQATEIKTHRARPIGYLAFGLLLDILLIQRAGFVVASTILFVCVARSFESRRPLRDLIAGLILATVSFLLFTKILLLDLPAGSLWGLG
jgi:putative tricarboxylic transport membrane protein